MDGILALGRPDTITGDHSGVNAPSFMDVLISQKVISSKFFGIALWRNSDGGNNNGEINFGSPDSSRYDGSLNYISAIKNSNGFWEIPVADAGVDGKSAGLTGRSAIIDSGTSFILMPQSDAATLHQLIPGSSQSGEAFTIPCTADNKVQISFGGTTYDISSKDYVGRALGGGSCSSNIAGRQTFGPTQWLVGDVFLKNVYAGFDYDGQRVGFGVKKGSSSSTSTASAAKSTKSTASTLTLLSPGAANSAAPTTAPLTSLLQTPNSPSPTHTPAFTASPPTSTASPTQSAAASSQSTSSEAASSQTASSQVASSLTTSSLTTSSPTASSKTVHTATATNTSAFTAGFLPPGSTFTTEPPSPSRSTTPASASSSPAVQKGMAPKEKPPAPLLALSLAVFCAVFFVV